MGFSLGVRNTTSAKAHFLNITFYTALKGRSSTFLKNETAARIEAADTRAIALLTSDAQLPKLL